VIFKHSKQINHQIEVVADMNDLRKLAGGMNGNRKAH